MYHPKPLTTIYMWKPDETYMFGCINRWSPPKCYEACFSVYFKFSGSKTWRIKTCEICNIYTYILYNYDKARRPIETLQYDLILYCICPIGACISQYLRGCNSCKCRLRWMLQTRCNNAVWSIFMSHPTYHKFLRPCHFKSIDCDICCRTNATL